MLCCAEQDSSQAEAAAAAPDFEDPHKAKAWQKLTHLQQRMLGLISAVEGQLSLSHSPDSALDAQASDHQPTAAASGDQSKDTHLALTTANQLGIAGDELMPVNDLQQQQAKGTDGGSAAQDCSSGLGESEDGSAAAAAVASAAAGSDAQPGGVADAEEAAGMLAMTGQEHEQVGSCLPTSTAVCIEGSLGLQKVNYIVSSQNTKCYMMILLLCIVNLHA